MIVIIVVILSLAFVVALNMLTHSSNKKLWDDTAHLRAPGRLYPLAMLRDMLRNNIKDNR